MHLSDYDGIMSFIQGKKEISMFKLKKFIFSNKNMVGIGFATLCIILALMGFLKDFWLLVTLIAYIFGYLIGSEEKPLNLTMLKMKICVIM